MAIGFSWGTSSLSYPFIMYILVSICLGLYTVKYMYTLNKQISAMIVLILLTLIFIFFGKRWFQHGQLKGSSAWTQANAVAQSGSIASASQCGTSASSAGPTAWPPIINYCPDFMTIDANGKCIDSAKLYGTSSALGGTIIQSYTGTSGVCPPFTGSPSPNTYLRWEGVIQAEGSCNSGNIGRAPSN